MPGVLGFDKNIIAKKNCGHVRCSTLLGGFPALSCAAVAHVPTTSFSARNKKFLSEMD